jgi:molybdopterin molybdotransferase
VTRARDALTYHEALERIMQATSPLPASRNGLTEALGRYLGEPLIAGADSPAFDNSAVDGYGVRIGDLAEATEAYPVSLYLAGSIRAGDSTHHEALEPSTTVQILTGAPVPAGVSAVVMQEDVVVTEDAVHFSAPIQAGANIRKQAEEYAKGSRLAEPGTLCSPAVVALAATSGHAELSVCGVPKVAIVSAGDELVEPGKPLGPGQIWESNSFGLIAALQAMGISSTRIRAEDTRESVRAAITAALDQADVVLTSGGVSVGDHDHVKSVCEDLGVKREFWGVRLKPGGPFYFGTKGDKKVFGLPGNPVSALVTFFVCVRPALVKMMGAREAHSPLSAKLANALMAKGNRLEMVRGRLQHRNAEVWVEPTAARDSHMLGGLAAADCLIHLPSEAGTMEAGGIVEVTPLRWSDL